MSAPAADDSTDCPRAGDAGGREASSLPADDDPPSEPAFTRRLSGGPGRVTLVGVVHDHPASVRRVREVIECYRPDVVALELPPVAVPLFEAYAADDGSPPGAGGEMTAAVRAADDARVVGVDAPDRRFLRALVARLRRDRPPLSVVRGLLGGLGSVARHALVCRAAAVLAALTGVVVEVDARVDHDVGREDPPAVQAADERRQVERSRSLLALGSSPPVALRDEVRESSVAAHLDDLRREADGGVVAVLGFDHLDGVARELRRSG